MFLLYTCVIAILVISVIVTRYLLDSLANYYLITRIYNILEYSILAYLFHLYIKNRIARKILLFSIIPFVIFCIYDFFQASKPALPFLPLIYEYLFLLIFIVYFFFEVMQQSVMEPIYNKAIFWISVGFIINFSGNFFLLLASVNSFDNEAFRNTFTIMYSSVTILKNILLSISSAIKENINNSNNDFDAMSLDPDLEPYQPSKNQK